MSQVYYFQRGVTDDCEAGLTVTRQSKLPDGDFIIDEYCWGDFKLWFVADDDFTADEREACRAALLCGEAVPS